MIWNKTYSPKYFINENGEVRTFDRCEYMPYSTPEEAYDEVQFILNKMINN